MFSIPRSLRLSATLLCCGLAATGCLGKEERDDTDTRAADAAADASTGGDTGGTDATGDTGGGVAPTFEPVCGEGKPACSSGTFCVSGVCAPESGADDKTALRDPTQDNIASTETINLDCVGTSIDEVVKDLPKDKKVVMWGRVDRFGGGGITSNIEVAVFEASKFHPEACAGIEDPEDALACYRDDAKVGAPLAKAISVDPGEAAAKGLDVEAKYAAEQECNKGVHLECPAGFVCDKVDGFPKCVKGHGLYAIEGVPANTPLVVRTRAVNPNDPNGWHDSYTFSVVLFTTHLDEKGKGHQPTKYLGQDTFRVNPTIVGEGQWQLVPSTIGVIGGIYEGDGVIGGRIRDCGTATRRSWPIVDARVGFGRPPEGLSYFNDSELDPVPSKNRVTTNIIGRYAAVGIPPGPNRVAVTGRIGGKTEVLGTGDVFVIPNSLVIVSLPGLVPYNNK
ncbi:MAG: hypothetical protein RIT45_4034 [Pseudomonadota bacterium]